MSALIVFWSHALAAILFVALLIWRLAKRRANLVSGCCLRDWQLPLVGPGSPPLSPTVRSSASRRARGTSSGSDFYSLATASDERQHGVRLVYGAVAAAIGMQLAADGVWLDSPTPAVAATSLILRITTAAGALVLVHNLYGQAAPASRSTIRLGMLGLAVIWIYDLNLYTVRYIASSTAPLLTHFRGVAVALTAPLFAWARVTKKAGAFACLAQLPSNRSPCSRSAAISR